MSGLSHIAKCLNVVKTALVRTHIARKRHYPRQLGYVVDNLFCDLFNALAANALKVKLIPANYIQSHQVFVSVAEVLQAHFVIIPEVFPGVPDIH